MLVHSDEPRFISASMPDAARAQFALARRTQILDAATRVFAEKGFHRAKIKEIAREAGVAGGTIYNYFRNKEDLAFALLDRLNETEQRAADFAQGLEMNDVRSFFLSYLAHRISIVWPNYEVFRATLPEILTNPELRTRYQTAFLEPTTRMAELFFGALVEADQIRPVDVPLTVRAIAGTVTGLLLMQMLGDNEIATRWEELPEVLTRLFFDGLTRETS